MKTFRCSTCDAGVFFDNQLCLACGGALAFQPDTLELVNPQAPEVAAAWQSCANRDSAACNWLVLRNQPVEFPSPLCNCCRHTRTIPPQNNDKHVMAWRSFERAKRYLFYSLLMLRLPMPDRIQQPGIGLVFDLLADQGAEKVVTGHDQGVITVNVVEADPLSREHQRIVMHEPYRTLLGHLRHETGHFYWQQLITKGPLEQYRQLFGDERADYQIALKQYYASAEVGNWQEKFISRYATAHPWEDWAECWAHYLHVVDALDTAEHWGIYLQNRDISIRPRGVAMSLKAEEFQQLLVQQWLPLSQYLNEASRSLGENDAYPFVISSVVLQKLGFIHQVVCDARLIR